MSDENPNQVDEHYIAQLKDSVSWLRYQYQSETDLDERKKLAKELSEASQELERLSANILLG